MSRSYPGSELNVEQLVHALTRALGPNTPPSPSFRQFIESGLQKISAIERDLSDILRATRGVKNTLILVNRLPPEILSRVLEHRVNEETLIKATHVCWHWRSTLTSSPCLWTNLWFRFSNNVDRALTYLKRSKSVPLHVKITPGFSEYVEAFQYLAPHMARMRSCFVQGVDINIHGTLARFQNSASLTNLEIHSERRIPLPIPSDLPSGLRPPFESPFPLPYLTEFQLSLNGNGPEVNVSALFRFLSYSPLLQKIHIVVGEVVYDDALDQVIVLDSLVGLHYVGNSLDRILPCLRLPHLQQLRVVSTSERVQNMVDLLPNGGRLLLTGATKMSYYSDSFSHSVTLSGEGLNVSLTTVGIATIDWLSDETYIPFGRIEDLTVEGFYVVPSLPINVFKNLRVLRVTLEDVSSTEGFWRSLFQAEEIPCRSLREILYTYQGSLDPLISLARERKRVGHQLELVQLFTEDEHDQDRVEELREHVVEVEVTELGEFGE